MSKLDSIYQKLEPVMAKHQNLVVVGGNWGDEGKGKVIDLAMRYFDAAVRFSGGANAGHTVFTPDGKKIVSHLIPCGLPQNKICVMGRGEFFNAELFLKELGEIKTALGGGELSPIYVDQQAPLWTPYHRLFETYIEIMRGEKKIGTTNKGIGPLEGLYKLRLAPVVGHLFSPDVLMAVLKSLFDVLKPCFDYVHPDTIRLKRIGVGVKNQNLMQDDIPSPESVRDELLSFSEKVKPFVADTSFLLNKMLKEGKKLLFEGAQATGLDAFWGTYPFVSSGNSVSQGAALGTGLPMNVFDAVILVCKTLPTRVGMGPFPSEMWERDKAMGFAKEDADLFVKGNKRDEFLRVMMEKINKMEFPPLEGEGKEGVMIDDQSKIIMSQYFQVLGDERGATTGRGRSLGFLDIPWIQYAVRINGPKYLALTRFDMLSGIKQVPVVVGYKLDGNKMEKGQVPPPWRIGEVETMIEQWEGFEENIYGISEFSELPKAAKSFIEKIELMVGVPILLIGTGAERDAVIVRQ